MRRSSILPRLLLSSVASVGLWIVAQHPLGGAVRGVVVAGAHLCGQRAYPVDDDRIALVVGPTPGGGEGRIRVFGVSLLRWHVNVIAAPILAMTLGAVPLLSRFFVSALAVVLTLALDGASVFFYLWLGTQRLRGAPLLAASVDDQLAYGIAVFGAKLVPVVAWAIAYGAVRYGARTGGAATSPSESGQPSVF
jgi:hypothetical protein